MPPPPKRKRAAPAEPVVETEFDEVQAAARSERVVIDASSIEADIKKLVGFSSFEPEQRYWLDTGSELMNAALGSRKRGLPYGKMYEIRGKNHGGKTALTTLLAGIAQRDNAAVGYIDLEDSRDEQWAAKLSLNYNEVVKVYPKLVRVTKKAPPRLESAEEIFAEAEAGMEVMRARGYKKQFWFMDSVAMLRPALVIEKGVTGQNMRTKGELAQFLSLNLPRWTGLAANYNAIIILINQIRDNPGAMFGPSEYSPGGNAFQHTCQCRASVRRIKNGRLKHGDKTVGLVGLVTNFKNKTGGGSQQDRECAFTIRWKTNPATFEFMTKAEAEALF